jgi:hypothetical protein
MLSVYQLQLHEIEQSLVDTLRLDPYALSSPSNPETLQSLEASISRIANVVDMNGVSAPPIVLRALDHFQDGHLHLDGMSQSVHDSGLSSGSAEQQPANTGVYSAISSSKGGVIHIGGVGTPVSRIFVFQSHSYSLTLT